MEAKIAGLSYKCELLKHVADAGAEVRGRNACWKAGRIDETLIALGNEASHRGRILADAAAIELKHQSAMTKTEFRSLYGVSYKWALENKEATKIIEILDMKASMKNIHRFGRFPPFGCSNFSSEFNRLIVKLRNWKAKEFKVYFEENAEGKILYLQLKKDYGDARVKLKDLIRARKGMIYPQNYTTDR